MGRGSDTKQGNVSKKSREYTAEPASETSGGSGAEGGGYDKSAANTCLFAFRAEVALVADANVGTKFVLVPGGQDGALQLIGSGLRIADYAGDHLDRVVQCIAGGYKYQGIVDAVERTDDGVVAKCSLQGVRPA
jgi:hypothetical protein